LHSFGREDQLDPQALERLMASIARHLDLTVTVPGGADNTGAGTALSQRTRLTGNNG
jgi:hypothetical protein